MTRHEFERWWEAASPREKDARIAERVMGGRLDGDTLTDGKQCWPVPDYTTGSAVWDVVEWLRNRWGQFELVAGLEWHCYPGRPGYISPGAYWGTGVTGKLAICKAALIEAYGLGDEVTA